MKEWLSLTSTLQPKITATSSVEQIDTLKKVELQLFSSNTHSNLQLLYIYHSSLDIKDGCN